MNPDILKIVEASKCSPDFKDRLVALLEAGQAMRDNYANNENWREAWDKRKQAAMEGR